MRERTVITRAMADAAAAVLLELIDPAHDGGPGDLGRERAATSLLRLWQTQQRFGLDEIAERAARPNASRAMRDLDALTDEELARLRAEMLSDFPGTMA
ncbi:MAG: hypothetical protein IT429_26050 [Gemmataceae bacterium]|nr:hypothetical protein [Gemmataceae bacterium]